MRLLHASLQVALRHWALTAAAVLGALGVLHPAAALAQAAATECDPTQMCCMASQIGGHPGCAGSGNPINVITGNKYQRETDLPALPGVLGLEIVRHYNSADSRHGSNSHIGILGRGWRLSYDIELHAAGNIVTLVQADGTPVSFARGFLNPRRFLPTDPKHGHLTPLTTSRGNEYLWTRRDGHELRFDAQGRLEQIKAPTGEVVTLQRDFDGMLVSVTDPQGRSLHLHNLERKTAQATGRFGGVQHIDSPAGRFSYEYGSARPAGADIDPVHLRAHLVKVTAPGPDEGHRASRLYHYEDPRHPTLLTGISISGAGSDGKPMHQRISTWAYDDKGRANLSVKGEPARLQTDKDGRPVQPYRLVEGTGIEQVVIERSQAGKTVATNSLGQTTVFSHALIAGESKLLEVRGAGCAHCAGPNLRYGYDKLGRLTETTRITPDGQPIQTTRTALDPHGRPSIVSRIDYRAGKPQPPQPVVRYEYDGDTPAPSLIATPSVVVGREHIVRIAYNDAGQPLTVTESGFSPLDDTGQPNPQGTAISRSTTYSYSTINGRSLLTQIDGPLDNGPGGDTSDSDVTRVEWDHRGSFITAMRAPGGFTSTMRYDEAGRLGTVTGTSGLSDRYTYTAVGQMASRVQTRAERVWAGTAYRYDTLGRATEQLAILGGQERESLRPQSAQGFDVAGRLLWQADRVGILRQARYDTEGRLLTSTVVGAGIQQQEHYTYDAHGRLQEVADNTGATRGLVHDAAGRIAATIDSLGRVTDYIQDPDAHAWQVTHAANTNKPLVARYGVDPSGRVHEVNARGSNGGDLQRSVTTRLLRDDFGREVANLNPDSGAVFKRYDAADRLVQVRDTAETVTDIAYDVAGRMIRRTVTPGSIPSRGATPRSTLFAYEGTRLVGIQHPNQAEHYTYDDLGRVASKTVRLTLAAGATVSSVARYRYDEQGTLVAQSLPDGSELQYERNGQGQVVAVFIQAGAWAPFGWGRSVLVKDLERDLIGVRHATYGNGIAGHWQRSREGVLARVVYTRPTSPQPSAVRTAFEHLMSQAHAESAAPPTPAPSVPPGAFGIAADPRDLWDSRLLFDAAGNILVQGQFAHSAAAQPQHAGYAYDAQNQLAQAVVTPRGPGSQLPVAVATGGGRLGTVWRYHHDSLGNRLLAQQQQPVAEMAHTATLAYADSTSDRLAAQATDTRGQALADGERGYQWDAEGRLAEIKQAGKTTASYRYNQRGERVSKQVGDTTQHCLYDERRQRLAELDAQGRITREYVWLGEQLIAVIDLRQPIAPRAPAEGFVQQLSSTVQALWASVRGHQPTLTYVHANHLGAPVAMTDENAKPVWSADYAPFGKRIAGETRAGIVKTAAPGHVPQAGVQGIQLDLRLPGQWEDAESGLYYNDHRYYDPERGRYLSPDPLGLNGGLNAYAYVGNNPVGFSDPLGLVLFAFDGTGNTNDEAWLRRHDSSLSNVWRFRQLYEDGNRRYVTGVGTLHRDAEYGDIAPPLGDMSFNFTGVARIDRMIQYFNDEANLAADDNIAMDVDIVGFSRGAAEARDFANQIASNTRDGLYRYTVTNSDGSTQTRCQRLNFRFMGLWDTVLSTNSGRGYNLAIPDEFVHVAQAVALNEFRGETLRQLPGSVGAFPLESIMPGMASPARRPGQTRIERGFIGAHSDIGGGFGANENQLSQVALAWMVQQANDAGVTTSSPPDTIVANPVLHDKSDNQYSSNTGSTRAWGEDRTVRYRGGATTTQRQMMFTAGMTFADTQRYINYLPPTGTDEYGQPLRTPRTDFVTGTVDMNGYLRWLADHGYDLHLTVQ